MILLCTIFFSLKVIMSSLFCLTYDTDLWTWNSKENWHSPNLNIFQSQKYLYYLLVIEYKPYYCQNLMSLIQTSHLNAFIFSWTNLLCVFNCTFLKKWHHKFHIFVSHELVKFVSSSPLFVENLLNKVYI